VTTVIKPDAQLSVQRIPIHCLQVKLHGKRYVERLHVYLKAMTEHPGGDILLHVTPSDTHPGMYCILDGHHRFVASIMAGRPDALCVIIEEEKGNATHV
jgi:hypothetical protein